ncbi:MAG: TetR/AcrR family transcriptional regulator [Solirubrobacterales bacterium]|nr:TetR/AcrR family transcriptional regulator [Solirubrobacterales bacterium]
MATQATPESSPRRDELLELSYRYVLKQGFAGLSLRPLAAAIGSSPRVLLFLFESKDGLIRALLARARADELALLDRIHSSNTGGDLATVAAAVWHWLAASEHRGLLRLWLEGYARSLVEPRGPWAEFASATVNDWLALFAATQPEELRHSPGGIAERTLTLAVLRGALLDLLATDDPKRTTAAVHRHLHALAGGGRFGEDER